MRKFILGKWLGSRVLQRRLMRYGLGWALVCVFTAGARAAEPNSIFDGNCALCHQKAGAGLRGQFPRLAGRVAQIAATANGKRYLMDVVLFGMAGKIEVDGVSIFGVMPSFAALSDEDLASVLNYVIQLDASDGKGQPPPITAAELHDVRAAEQLSPTQVNANRQSMLANSGKAPKAR